MIRIIKFRAWDENNDFMFYQDEYGEFERKIDEQRVGPDFSVQDLLFMSFEFLTAMQFTGLKDKNGVEIYEGDLLLDRFPIDDEDLSKGYHESFLPVVWCSKTLQWCVDASFEKDGSYLTSLVEYFGEFLEVKGNIYENS